jgi:hypothetical protein
MKRVVDSNRGPVVAEAPIPLAPKSNGKPQAGDPIDRAAQAILGLVHRTASDVEAKNKQFLGRRQQLSAELQAAEDRIRELEAQVRYHEERADRAEKWLYRIALEMEQQVLGREAVPPLRPPSPQELLRGQRH